MPKMRLATESEPAPKGGFFIGYVMHPVLKNAIENPRMPQPYGSDKGDYGFENIGVRGVDTYIKTNFTGWWNAERTTGKPN